LGRQSIGPNQRRPADLSTDGGLAVEREQFVIAPHVAWPRLDFLAADRFGDSVVVVLNFERAEIIDAEVERLLGILLAAHAAFQPNCEFRIHKALPEGRLPVAGVCDPGLSVAGVCDPGPASQRPATELL